MPIQESFQKFKIFFRQSLAGTDALPQLTAMGILVGITTAIVIVLFRFMVEWPLSLFLPEGDPENFEGLSTWLRITLPLSGAFVIGVLWYRLRISQRKVGVALVMERLNNHQGYISFRSLATQFVGGILTISSGQSAGREGPAVHLGAASASLLGQKFKLPHNSIRTLVGCGTAAAISASFNTPIAGVIFAMEVVMMEYTIAGFTPVIMASVIAALLTQAVYGSDPAFLVPQLFMNSLYEVPYIIICGIVMGIASALFVRLLRKCLTYSHYSIFYRICIAGLVTAAIAVYLPEVMGIGYDTVTDALWGKLGIGILCAVALGKIIATAVSVGLGMPNGLVGPTLFIGATLGGAMGMLAQWAIPETSSSPGFYAMLGMGAMMGSVLQAPLAALMALLELTQNPNIILPGMLIIVVSSMFASEVFKQKSVFLTILEAQGMKYQDGPMIQALRRVSVGALMERHVAKSKSLIDLADVKATLKQEPKWLIITSEDGNLCSALPTIDLARYVSEHEEQYTELDASGNATKKIDLFEIPAQRKEVTSITYQATLKEAFDKMEENKVDMLYIERMTAPMISRIVGVISKTDIDNHYQYRRH